MRMLKDSEILKNDIRRNIYKLILQQPFQNATEIEKKTGYTHPNVLYHLRRLHVQGLICRKSYGHVNRYYPSMYRYGDDGKRIENNDTGIPRGNN